MKCDTLSYKQHERETMTQYKYQVIRKGRVGQPSIIKNYREGELSKAQAMCKQLNDKATDYNPALTFELKVLV